MQMCVYCPEGDVVKKKNRQNPELEIAPWAKCRRWARAQTRREDRKKGGGAGGKKGQKEVEKTSTDIPQELIKKSQLSPVFVKSKEGFTRFNG